MIDQPFVYWTLWSLCLWLVVVLVLSACAKVIF